MAERSIVFTKAQVKIGVAISNTGVVSEQTAPTYANAIDVSKSVKSVELSRVFDMLDDTVMGETARSRKAGLEDVTATIEFVQTFTSNAPATPDRAANTYQENIDAILSKVADISQSGKSVEIYIKPTAAATGATNPLYQFSAVLESHTPMSGGVGEILMTSVPFRSAGGSLKRITT